MGKYSQQAIALSLLPAEKVRRKRGCSGGVVVKQKKYIRVVCGRWLLCAGLCPVTDLFPRMSWRDRVDGSSRLYQCLQSSARRFVPLRFQGRGVDPRNLRCLRRVEPSIKALIPTKFALVNAHSLGNKTFILNNFIGMNKLDVFCISETWFKVGDSSPFSKLLPKVYPFINSPRPSGSGGWSIRINDYIQ